jgi:ferredoxin
VLEPGSRLSCQIIYSEALDGLTLTLVEGAAVAAQIEEAA